MPNPAEVVSTYFLAKDGNHPFLMRRAFAQNAQLEMIVKTDAISFPSAAKGLNAIEDILCRRFANDFENVYTFCLARPTHVNRRHFPCNWLVAMAEKDNGPIRVGSGRYDWHFSPDGPCLAERLIITIDVMQVVPGEELDRIMNWIASLPYPWCSPSEALEDMPATDGLAPIEHYLKTVRPLAPQA
ncbi:hypothetical protein MRS76_05180 [Rhizobiaceae bacterium n13]|uniref:Uncharacterized protein n=1 Tax=Ferirhizobium litorale TaxID=2927786 RepID=A0AAE3QCS9_9HYPH|nr:hypothetical protein [Fererhizobium litorale]MDI7861341.1 hypothetical protein [Fererhizobium litorale]MDI7921488.1 hypothetical protein [Fererhizobium litorale]